ncbi:MAG: hypothetical protein WDA75_04335 [Candidatus Latescibacterota bacterium]|jgi:hypothetical protein
MRKVLQTIWLIGLSSGVSWAALPVTGSPAKAIGQVLDEVISESRDIDTRQVLQRMAERAGLSVLAMQDTLSAALAGTETGLQRGDTVLVQLLETRAAAAGIRPANARRFLLGLVRRLQQVLDQGQTYQIDRLLAAQAKQAGVPTEAARTFLLALAEAWLKEKGASPMGGDSTGQAAGQVRTDRDRTKTPILEDWWGPASNAATERVPPGSGLLIEGRSTYDLDRDLQYLTNSTAQAGLSSSNMDAYAVLFSTRDVQRIRQELTDLHRRILPLLVQRIDASPLRMAAWRSEYRLRFDVMDLEVMGDYRTEGPPGASCSIQIRLRMERAADNRAVPFPMTWLGAGVRKEKSSSEDSLELLCRQAADRIHEVLERWWAERENGEPRQ